MVYTPSAFQRRRLSRPRACRVSQVDFITSATSRPFPKFPQTTPLGDMVGLGTSRGDLIHWAKLLGPSLALAPQGWSGPGGSLDGVPNASRGCPLQWSSLRQSVPPLDLNVHVQTPYIQRVSARLRKKFSQRPAPSPKLVDSKGRLCILFLVLLSRCTISHRLQAGPNAVSLGSVPHRVELS